MNLNKSTCLDAKVCQNLESKLTIELENGWGWEKVINEQCEPVEISKFYGKNLVFKLKKALLEQGKIFGLQGVLIGEDLAETGNLIYLIPISDGLDYNFDDNLCECWRIVICDTDEITHTSKEVTFIGNRIMGWGRCVRRTDNH